MLDFHQHGELIVQNSAYFPESSVININGILRLGRNFGCNSGLLISCEKAITIGDNIAIGWDVTVVDSDGHDILVGENVINKPQKVSIGDHCWLCSKSSILKGSLLPDGTIVGYGTIVSGILKEPNTIVAGNPCRAVKTSIEWRR